MSKSKPKKSRAAPSGADICPLLAEVLKEGRLQLAVVTARRKQLRKGSFDEDLANAAATIIRAITGAQAELRQQEKHLKNVIEQMSEDEMASLIVAWLREASKQRRAAVLRQVAEFDAGETLLS